MTSIGRKSTAAGKFPLENHAKPELWKMQPVENLLHHLGAKLEPLARFGMDREQAVQPSLKLVTLDGEPRLLYQLQSPKQSYLSSIHGYFVATPDDSNLQMLNHLYLIHLQMERVLTELKNYDQVVQLAKRRTIYHLRTQTPSSKFEPNAAIPLTLQLNFENFIITLQWARRGLFSFSRELIRSEEQSAFLGLCEKMKSYDLRLASLRHLFAMRPPSHPSSTSTATLAVFQTESPMKEMTSLYQTISSSLNYLTLTLVDPAPTWKRRRYENYLYSFKKLIPEEFQRPPLLNEKEPNQKTNRLDSYLSTIATLFHEESSAARTLYKKFQSALRNSLLEVHDDAHDLIHSSKKESLNKLCLDWFTNMIQLPFLEQLVFDLVGKPSQELLFSSRMRHLWFNLRQLSAQAETITLAAKKISKITSTFDPLADMNMPWQLHETLFGDDHGTSRCVHFRTAVPVGPRQREGSSDLPWEQGTITLVAEYIGMLKAIEREKKRVLLIVHLDPKCYETSQKEPLATTYWDYLDPLKPAEAIWIHLLKRTADHFRSSMELCLLPIDGSWFKEIICSYSFLLRLDFKKLLLTTMTKENSPFLFPSRCGVGEQLSCFLDRIIDEVDQQYFSELLLLGRTQKLAFLGLLHSRLIEHLQLLCNADYVQHNCTEGADRTMALAMSSWVEMAWRLSLFDALSLQEQIMGSGNGVAMTVCKRAMEEERAEVAWCVVEHLETLRSNLPRITPSHGKKLLHFHLAALVDQMLLKPAASAESFEEYQKIIHKEGASQHLASQRLSYPHFATKLRSCVSSNEERQELLIKNLKMQKVFLDDLLIDFSTCRDHQILPTLMVSLDRFGIRETNLIEELHLYLTQNFFDPLFDLCHERYDHPNLGISLISNSSTVYHLYKKEEGYTLIGSRNLFITKEETILAQLTTSTEVSLGEEMIPAYIRWTITPF